MNSKNHHGFIVTSPTGSVSLLDLPVPTHESIAKASQWGKAQGKPFVITPASKFYATAFGKQVRALTHKKLEQKKDRKIELLHLFHPKEETFDTKLPGQFYPKNEGLTNLLNRIKQAAQNRRLEAKIAEDTRKRYPTQKERDKLVIAKQMRTVGQALDNQRQQLADKSSPPIHSSGIARASDSDFAHLFMLQDAATQDFIDKSSKFRWDKKRVNKLVKLSEGPPTSKSISAILILFRSGKLPEKIRTYKRILKLVNK